MPSAYSDETRTLVLDFGSAAEADEWARSLRAVAAREPAYPPTQPTYPPYQPTDQLSSSPSFPFPRPIAAHELLLRLGGAGGRGGGAASGDCAPTRAGGGSGRKN